jgi:hypothetical protein
MTGSGEVSWLLGLKVSDCGCIVYASDRLGGCISLALCIGNGCACESSIAGIYIENTLKIIIMSIFPP